MPSKLGYWNIRGIAQPICLLLGYVGEEFEEVRFNLIGSCPDWDLREWTNAKFTFGLDFPNIPFYIDDKVKVTQSLAILKYLGRKYDLVPRDDDEKLRIDMIEGEALDLRTSWVAQNYGNFTDPYDVDMFNKNKPGFIERTSAKLKEFSVFLGDRPFFAGDHLTYIDFVIYELLEAMSTFEPSLWDGVANLKAFHDRIEQLPTLAAFMKSDKCFKGPFNTPVAGSSGR